MISRINGELIAIRPPQIVVEAFGIGYELDLTMPDCAELPSTGSKIALFTHLIIREDLHSLYGFLKITSRDCFRQLIKVSGIGPRIALAILSTLTLEELMLAINQNDSMTLSKTPGVGKKMAERMLLELKGKLQLEMDFIPSNPKLAAMESNVRNDISHALSSLGFNDKEILAVLRQLPEISDLSIGIKEALKLLTK